jgi:hypothetical protein
MLYQLEEVIDRLQGLFRSKRFCILISFVFGLLTLVKINWYMPHSYDIWLWDETWYLHNGISEPRDLFYFGDSYENAPLYSSFYTIVHYFWHDPIYTYFYGGAIVIVLSLVISFVAFFVVSNSLLFSLACVGILTIGNAANTWPRVCLAAIALIGATFVSAHLCKTLFSAASVVTVGAFLAALIRPEFVLSLYLLTLVTAILAIKKVINFRSTWCSAADVPALISIACLLSLAVVWSFPILRLSARGFSAFGQHFAVRVVAEQKLHINPWVNWQRITEQAFPGANSVVSAFIVNPGAVGRFLFENALGTIRLAISTYILSITPWRGLSRIIPLVFYAVLAYQVLRACPLKVSQMSRFSRADKIMACAIIIFMTPVAISCIVVYPRDHYLVLWVFLVLMLISVFVRHLKLEGYPVAIVLSSCILFWFTPPLHVMSQPNLNLIEKLRDLKGISTMVEIDGGWCTYLSPQCKTIFAYDLDKAVDLQTYFDENRVDTIFVSKELLSFAPVAANPQFARIIQDPTANGWTVKTLNRDNYLVMRKIK